MVMRDLLVDVTVLALNELRASIPRASLSPQITGEFIKITTTVSEINVLAPLEVRKQTYLAWFRAK